MFHVDHYAISVKDADKSIDFYKKLNFSLVKDYRAEDGSVRIVHMTNGGFILEMFCYPNSDELPEFVKSLNTDHVWAPVYKPTLTDMFCFPQ